MRNPCSHLLSCSLFMLALPAMAEPITVALGESKAPYILAESKAGVEYDLVTSILREAGFSPVVVHMPNQRAIQSLAEGRVDAAISLSGPYVSERYIAYRNMAIALCSSQLKIDSIAALGKWRVAAFQNAHRFLGQDFAAMAASNPQYIESSPQATLVNLLYSKRTDVVISDIYIFRELARRQTDLPINTWQTLCSFDLFQPTSYSLSFQNPGYRNRFDKALAKLRKDGLYEAMAKRYQLLDAAKKPLFKPELAKH